MSMCKSCGMENALSTDKQCWNCGKPLGSFAAPPCWTAPSDVPPDIAKKILAARDALINDRKDEAWHQLYSIADPTFESYDPWKFLEKQSNEKVRGGGPSAVKL